MAKDAVTVPARARTDVIERIPKNKIQETLNSIQHRNKIFEASNIIAILDNPFVVLYIGAIWFLSQALALVTLSCILLVWVVGLIITRIATKKALELQKATMEYRADQGSAVQNQETVRAFQGKPFIYNVLGKRIEVLSLLSGAMADSRELSQSVTLAGTTLMTVAVYAIGSVQVVEGTLSIGALIGTSILASRAVMVISRFIQVKELFSGLYKTEQEIQAFLKLPLERETGTGISHYTGRIECKDVAFAWPGQSEPLFESLNLSLNPGDILTVTGYNGAGKTTLARLLAGLIPPTRGTILIDGVNLFQTAPDWWRKQIIYAPQEPRFLRTSILKNITLVDPKIDPTHLNQIIVATNMRPFLDTSPQGLETFIHDSGEHLPLGIRRRLALARALVTDGNLVILDEPTEGLDAAGCHAVYTLMNGFAKAGKTIIAFTQDEKILKGARQVLDLSVKPVPQIHTRQ